MKRIGSIILESVNALLAIVIFVFPFILPTVSSSNRIEGSFSIIWMVFFFGLFFGLSMSLIFSQLDDDQKKSRDKILHYFPLWSLPLFYAVMALVTLIVHLLKLEFI